MMLQSTWIAKKVIYVTYVTSTYVTSTYVTETTGLFSPYSNFQNE